MITYNPKHWWRLIFAFHKSDTFRRLLPAILSLAIYSGLMALVEIEFLHLSFKNTTVVHSIIGVVLSFLLVFRTNSAYDRWWEGRKAWGSFTNNSRNLSLKLSVILPEKDPQRREFAGLIHNYLTSASHHLRGTSDISCLRFSEKYPIAFYSEAKHLPNRIHQAIYKEVNELYKKNVISGEQLLFLNTELISFTDNIGICERIRSTPVPYSYLLYLKKLIFIYIFTMPIGFVMEFGYWTMIIVPMVFYAFASIELIGEEIEDPFGTDANDLPTDEMALRISSNVFEILGEKNTI